MPNASADSRALPDSRRKLDQHINPMKPVYLSWSGGKDATLALDKLMQSSEYEVRGLLTTVNEHFQRVSMHGLRIEIVEQQADALGLPIEMIRLPKEVDYEIYEQHVKSSMTTLRESGIHGLAYGDIFLEDLKQYREKMLTECGLEGIYPMWQLDTGKLAEEFIRKGYRSIVISVNGTKLNSSFAGRNYDASFLNDLPSGTDPCGENGEFHSFVTDGPVFKYPVSVQTGSIEERHYGGDRENRAYFCDLLPA